MKRSTSRRGIAALAATAVVLGSPSAFASGATGSAPEPAPDSAASGGSAAAPPESLGADVAQALFDAAPSIAVMDDSVTTGCMSGTAEPVVYRGDRIALRTTMGKFGIRQAVNQALGSIGSPALAGVIDIIDLPVTTLAETSVTPLVSVELLDPDGDPIPIVELARTLRDLEKPIPASPDYVSSPSSGPTGMWPDGFPEISDVKEPLRDKTHGEGVDIWLYDTGLPKKADGAWAPNVSRLTPDDVEILDADEPLLNLVDIYSGGHSLAIADVINTVAPAADVEAVRITLDEGIATDLSAARRLARTLIDSTDWPEIIVASFGSPACEDFDGDDMVPVGLQAVAEAVSARGGTIIVAAAGNRSSDRPFYPAALESDSALDAIVAVGALDTAAATRGDAWSSESRSGPVAAFSNHGEWVDAWAPGVGLTTRHVKKLAFEDGGKALQGRAEVRGTSFAAPYVAALIAETISTASLAEPLGPFDAWDLIVAAGVECTGEQGGVAVALTTMERTATTDPAIPDPEC